MELGGEEIDSAIMKAREELKIGTQGVKMMLVKEGEGRETPHCGDQVEVVKGCDEGIKTTMKKGENTIFINPPELAHGESGTPTILRKAVKYEARLEDGTIVSKSDGVEFILKDGYFVPAISKAVNTMKKGEKVLLTVKPQYGFGESGRQTLDGEGFVPPNATLTIDLELVSWKAVMNSGAYENVIKKILKEGNGNEQPNDGVVVKVNIVGMLPDGTVFVKKGHDRDEPFEFKTGEEAIIEGLDRAVLTMKKGEVAWLEIPPELAFGSYESKQDLAAVPPNTTVYYKIELVSFEKDKELCDMNTVEKLEAAAKINNAGNLFFKTGNFAKASKRYEKASKYIEYESPFTSEEKRQSKELIIIFLLNNASCKLRLRDYKEAEKLCTKVLELDSMNVKALYRRAKAYIHLSEFELAKLDNNKALEFDPVDRELKAQRKFLKENVKECSKIKGGQSTNLQVVNLLHNRVTTCQKAIHTFGLVDFSFSRTARAVLTFVVPFVVGAMTAFIFLLAASVIIQYWIESNFKQGKPAPALIDRVFGTQFQVPLIPGVLGLNKNKKNMKAIGTPNITLDFVGYHNVHPSMPVRSRNTNYRTFSHTFYFNMEVGPFWRFHTGFGCFHDFTATVYFNTKIAFGHLPGFCISKWKTISVSFSVSGEKVRALSSLENAISKASDKSADSKYMSPHLLLELVEQDYTICCNLSTGNSTCDVF